MARDTKIIQVAIVDGNIEDIKALRDALEKLKESLPYDVEFLVTNDSIQLRDIKYLIDSLYILYKKEKELQKKVRK
jgi:hypothetical protein